MCLEKECYLCEAGYWVNKARHIFTRNRILPYRLINAIVQERNGIGVFRTAYRYNTENLDEAFLFGDMYFDFDCKDDFQKVREDALKVMSYLKVVFKIPTEHIEIYFSGNKGVHLIIPSIILGVEPNKNLNGIFRCIAESARSFTRNKTLDLVIYDNKRLFRIPGTRHESTNLYKIPITEDELRNTAHEEIRELAKNKRIIKFNTPKHSTYADTEFKKFIQLFADNANKKAEYTITGTLKCTPPCMKFLIDNGATDGNRNNSTAAVASFYKAKGMQFEETLDKITEWNNTLNSPPLKQTEVMRTIRSIYSGKANYGCNALRILSECKESECPLKKGRKKK